MTSTRPTTGSKSATTSSAPPATTNKVKCKCDHLATRLVSKTEKNPGRAFYQCYKGRDDPKHCNFFAWEDMIPGIEASTAKTPTRGNPASPSAKYIASLAAKASPIPKAGNYSKAFGGSTQGYTLAGPSSGMQPITSIPHPLHPSRLVSDEDVRRNTALPGMRTTTTDLTPDSSQDETNEPAWLLSATPDDIVEEPASQLPDMTIGAGWNSAKKRAMAKKRREMIIRALKEENGELSSTDEEEAEQAHDRPDSIETFEPAEVASNPHFQQQQQQQQSDDFDLGGISWEQIDADAVEASASQIASRTPRAVTRRTSLRAETSPSLPHKSTFMDRLNAVNDPLDSTPSASKKRKRHLESDDYADGGNGSRDTSVYLDAAASTPYASARGGTLTPPDTRERGMMTSDIASDLKATSSAVPADFSSSASIIYSPPVVPAHASSIGSSVHPLLAALNKDLIKQDRKVAADEKSREMLRGRVKALEARVRELEGELRRVTSERR
ncbi:hypothetical protein QFC22_002686 [Naganishia vaughanmartiniae]|uniref:Uncharacterized protein n=1 Tax=Naganishia vaughanmartiniae TaxID=1424756 RepID=A0ACC2XAZ7_9TREE|nr:hypothetical protein QFC22_002686 [Naganishia vaughanmartiniae]